MVRADGTASLADLGPVAEVEAEVERWRAAVGEPAGRGIGGVAAGRGGRRCRAPLRPGAPAARARSAARQERRQRASWSSARTRRCTSCPSTPCRSTPRRSRPCPSSSASATRSAVSRPTRGCSSPGGHPPRSRSCSPSGASTSTPTRPAPPLRALRRWPCARRAARFRRSPRCPERWRRSSRSRSPSTGARAATRSSLQGAAATKQELVALHLHGQLRAPRDAWLVHELGRRRGAGTGALHGLAAHRPRGAGKGSGAADAVRAGAGRGQPRLRRSRRTRRA